MCDICKKDKPLSNWAATTKIGDQEEQVHVNVCVDCQEALLLVATTFPDVQVALVKKCECCHKPVAGEGLYHPGTHRYVCSFACHKHLTEKLIEGDY